MTLQLEYSYTKAELVTAQKLFANVSRSRGSALPRVVPFLAIAATLPLYVYLTKLEDAWRIGLLCLVAFFAAGLLLYAFLRLTRRKTDRTVRVDISESEIVFTGGGGRNVAQWSAYSQFLESEGLFVLVHRTNALLFLLPKRAFPNEEALNWFRTRATRPLIPASATPPETPLPAEFTGANGLALTLRPQFSDSLDRFRSSALFQMVAVFFLLIAVAIAFVSPSFPNAVNSNLKLGLILIPVVFVTLLIVLLCTSLAAWANSKNGLRSLHLLITSHGVDFAGPDNRGLLPWTDYKYYLETRWSFFVWNPQGALWFMIPKRTLTSQSDLEHCRTLLQSKLKPSRWFVC